MEFVYTPEASVSPGGVHVVQYRPLLPVRIQGPMGWSFPVEPYRSIRRCPSLPGCDLTACGLEVWFDRMAMPSRGLTFHQEMKDAVAARERLVFVVGPKAAVSYYVRQEWQIAHQADKAVTPILRQRDYPLVPDELKLLLCEDFRDDAQHAFDLKQG